MFVRSIVVGFILIVFYKVYLFWVWGVFKGKRIWKSVFFEWFLYLMMLLWLCIILEIKVRFNFLLLCFVVMNGLKRLGISFFGMFWLLLIICIFSGRFMCELLLGNDSFIFGWYVVVRWMLGCFDCLMVLVVLFNRFINIWISWFLFFLILGSDGL